MSDPSDQRRLELAGWPVWVVVSKETTGEGDFCTRIVKAVSPVRGSVYISHLFG